MQVSNEWMGESGVWSHFDLPDGVRADARWAGGPLHSSVYYVWYIETPAGLLASCWLRRRRFLPVEGVGMMICRSVVGNGRPHTTRSRVVVVDSACVSCCGGVHLPYTWQ